ncbi:uncharacterized protein JCM6883_006104 [Sporobolomyces salmoneus]|uniref:uncharacterized protein n=1 Tax=Sporobolomyces salmoneus TaxID=183962 RepID=UPI0031799DE6
MERNWYFVSHLTLPLFRLTRAPRHGTKQFERQHLLFSPSRPNRSLPSDYSLTTAARVSGPLQTPPKNRSNLQQLVTVASAHQQTSGGGGGGPTGTGFKLKLTLGGSTAPPAPVPAVQPAPIHAPSQPSAHWSQGGGGGIPVHSGPPPVQAAVAPQYSTGVVQEEEKRVSAEKYKKLKRKYLEAIESRDEASLSLYRAQKLIHRLREEKSSLLDRVLELEIAAGITSADVETAHQADLRTERELAFPLLNPPDLPSTEDRPRPLPVLTTSTDFTNSNYNAPLGPAPLPKTFPPRQRSQHLQSAIAAQRLRDDYDSKLAAQGLQRASFPAVAALGLEGSNIALTVERALAGEPLEAVSADYQPQQPARGNKRRRQSSTGGGGGKGRSAVAPQASIHVPQQEQPPPLGYLPNPFASAGAVPEGSMMARNSAEALAAAQANAAAEMQQHQQLAHNPYEIAVGSNNAASATPGVEYEMDEDGGGSDVSPGGGGAMSEGEDYKPNISGAGGGRKGARQSTGPERPTKYKRSKGSVLTPGVVSIPYVPRNADGTPRLPLAAGIMTLNSLGVVTNQEGFTTERYIFPIGYEAVRRYPSMVNKTADAEYACRIADGGQGGPRFELHPSDQPGVVIHASTPTGAWAQVVKAANKLRERNHSNSVSGPDYFGLSNNLVKALIQELPGANLAPGYVPQTFVEDLAPAAAPVKGKKGKKAGGRRKLKAAMGDEGEDYSSYGIDVEEGGAYDTSGYGNGIGETYTREGSYDSDSYPASASPEHSTGYGGGGGGVAGGPEYSNPASLANLLQGGGAGGAQSDPYSIPGFGAPSAPTAPFDPYAIPPAQPAYGAIDPAFGGGGGAAYNPTGSYGAYDLPGGQAYASSEASST